jgi:hypothetical protein
LAKNRFQSNERRRDFTIRLSERPVVFWSVCQISLPVPTLNQLDKTIIFRETPFNVNKIVRLNTALIKDWDSFHSVSKDTFGFPDFYGNNMDAWVDCMTDIDDDTLMSNILIGANDALVIELIKSDEFKKRCPEIYLALFECVAFINHRKIEFGEQQAMIAVSTCP